jgi:NAD(P)-dependent dehydrogenase (short-subunit alcohol dehydrogenase family)
MDVTDRASIEGAHARIAQAEGKLHVLVNNSGQVGPCHGFLNNPDAPEHASAETLGKALFENETPKEWADVYTVNTASVFFVTTRFLGLLAEGSKDVPAWTASVINITSISGFLKLAQRHVRARAVAGRQG